MANLSNIRVALAAAVSTVGIPCSPWWLSNPSPPAAHVYPDEMDYHKAMGNGASNWSLTVEVFVSLATDRGAQQVLDAMLAEEGTKSVKAAIEADRTLAGTTSIATVTRTTGYRVARLPSTQSQVLSAQWSVEIIN